MEVENDPKDVKFFTRDGQRAFIHPGSVCFKVGKFDSGWLAVSQLGITSKLFTREASMVPMYAVLLFGGELQVSPSG